ncbi:MAG: Hydrolase, alpha/beta fold family, partial [uncultured Solirubrobacteraceae bacterium]
ATAAARRAAVLPVADGGRAIRSVRRGPLHGHRRRRAAPRMVDPRGRTAARARPLLPRQCRQHRQPCRLRPAPRASRLRRAAVRLSRLWAQQRTPGRARHLPGCARGAGPTARGDRNPLRAHALSRGVARCRGGHGAGPRGATGRSDPPIRVHRRARHGSPRAAARAEGTGAGRLPQPAADPRTRLPGPHRARGTRRRRPGRPRTGAPRRRPCTQAARSAARGRPQRHPGGRCRAVARRDHRLERGLPSPEPGLSRL